jgi:hypothetical protein
LNLQVAFANALMHVKGYAAPETNAAVEQARLLIERANAQGEPPDDPLLLFSVLYGLWVASVTAFRRVSTDCVGKRELLPVSWTGS